MKILVVGDLHFKDKNLDVMSIVTSEILRIIEEQKPDLCVLLGDTLHNHEKVNLQPLTAATKFILECANKCKIILLIGNHDRINNSDFQTDIHPFNGLKSNSNITVVDKAIWDKENNLLYVPFVPPGRYRDALVSVGWSITGPQPILGFSHQEFRGAKTAHHVSEKGDPWSDQLFQQICGHFHEFQVIPGVIYVGTPIQHDFGDSPDKALLLITIDDKSRSCIQYERIPINGIKPKVVLHLTQSDLNDFQSKIPPNAEVKVFLHISETDSIAVKKNPQYKLLLEQVNTVAVKAIADKITHAAKIVQDMPIETKLNLEDVVTRMLADDPDSTQIFQSEIL